MRCYYVIRSLQPGGYYYAQNNGIQPPSWAPTVVGALRFEGDMGFMNAEMEIEEYLSQYPGRYEIVCVYETGVE